MTASNYCLTMLLALVCTGLLFTGCEKEEGEGGRSSISGRVIEQEISSSLNPVVVQEYPLGAERVYIIYGDSTQIHDDDIRTDYQGRYIFRYLRKGTYTVFTYTECNVNHDEGCVEAGGVFPVIRTVELGKNEDVVLEDIIIQNY